MMHAYRSGKYPISPKAWRKLEAAERAAGIAVIGDQEEGGSVGKEGHVKYPTAREAKNNPPPEKGLPAFTPPSGFSRLEEISARINAVQEDFQQAIQQATAGFSMEELISRMQAANAWPPSPEDAKLSPAFLMLKYQPPAGSSRKRDLEEL